jgi:mono/diheme cytochrome c family protein
MAAATRTLNQIMAMKSSVLFLSMVAGALAASAADVDISKLPPASDKKGVTYDKDIKAIFEKSCFKCHGPEKQKGKLRLDSLAAALKGGEDGKILEPGNSAKSTIVHAVARLVEDDAMPPADKGEPLSKEQVGLIRAWIDQGAK